MSTKSNDKIPMGKGQPEVAVKDAPTDRLKALVNWYDGNKDPEWSFRAELARIELNIREAQAASDRPPRSLRPRQRRQCRRQSPLRKRTTRRASARG
jgi:hypothetical protein